MVGPALRAGLWSLASSRVGRAGRLPPQTCRKGVRAVIETQARSENGPHPHLRSHGSAIVGGSAYRFIVSANFAPAAG